MPHPVLKATEQAAGALQSHMVSAHQREPPFLESHSCPCYRFSYREFYVKVREPGQGICVVIAEYGAQKTAFLVSVISVVPDK